MFQFQTWTRGALAHFEFLDRQSRNLGSVFDAGLRDLDDCFRNHFREGVVAVLDTERRQRLFVCFNNEGNLFRRHAVDLQMQVDRHLALGTRASIAKTLPSEPSAHCNNSSGTAC